MAVLHAYARGTSPLRSPLELIVTTPAETLRATSPTPTTAAATDCDPSAAAPHDRGAAIPVAIVAESGTYLSPEATRRLACDCGLVEAAVDARGEPLSVGRKTRTIPAPIKRALLLRDRACRFPGCDRRLFLDGHHLQHWADGGETSLTNLALLCSTHHAFMHEGGHRIEQSPEGALSFFDPRGQPVVAVPARPRPPQLGWPVIRAANAAADLSLSAETSQIKGRWGRLDHHDAVGRLLRATPPPASLPQEPAATPPSPPWRGKDFSALPPIAHPPHCEEDDPPWDYDHAGEDQRFSDLLAWSMEVLLATGVDPMATVPQPFQAPAGWTRGSTPISSPPAAEPGPRW